jgi:hypothetical protein
MAVASSWGAFARAEPEMAATGRDLLDQHGIVFLATVRTDGSPRLHPVCPFLLEDGLFVATPVASLKGRDQQRDGRYAMHWMPGKDDAEFRIRGLVRLLPRGADRDGVIARGPHYARDEDLIFEYDIAEAATAYWVNVGQPGTYAVRRRWVAQQG